MNDIEKHALRRWLVVQFAGIHRARGNLTGTPEEWTKGFLDGQELTLSKIAVRLFGTDTTIDIVNEAEKEATY